MPGDVCQFSIRKMYINENVMGSHGTSLNPYLKINMINNFSFCVSLIFD